MSNLIKTEESNRRDLFTFYDTGKNIVELTTENVSTAMSIINLDYNYHKAADKEEGPSKNKDSSQEENYNLGGSSAYWFSELMKKKSEYGYKIIISNCVNAVDRENSTHLNADGVGRCEISERICKKCKNVSELMDVLKNPAKELIQLISEKTNEGRNRSRTNVSFASKFCQIACYFLFDNLEEQDNYSKYDIVVRNVILSGIYQKKFDLSIPDKKSLDKYKNEEKFGELYKQYSKYIDDIIEKLPEKISRHGFDQLIWFFYKGKSEKYLKDIFDNLNK